jgi:hypothetical protein
MRPVLSAMFGAAGDGYVVGPGPRSLGLSNPRAYGWLTKLYLDGPGLRRWASVTAWRGPGAIGPGQSATFDASARKAYAGGTGPLSLGLCQSECLSMGSRKPT